MMKEQSFSYVKDLYYKVMERRNAHSDVKFRKSLGRRVKKPVPCVLVAAKCDLFDERNCKFLHEIEVFVKETKVLYVRCSSRTGMGLPRVHKSIVGSLVVRRSSIEPLMGGEEEGEKGKGAGVESEVMVRW